MTTSIDSRSPRSSIESSTAASSVSRSRTPRFFLRVCHELSVIPTDLVFVDDSESNVAAAAEVGLHAHLFTSTAQLKDMLLREAILD